MLPDQWTQFKDEIDAWYATLTIEQIEDNNDFLAGRWPERYGPEPVKEFQPCPPVFIPEHLQAAPHKREKKEWIYWLTSPAKQGVKIGRTYRHLSLRLKQIARQLKAEVHCIDAFQTPHCEEVELLAHGVFEDFRIGGEWFNLQPEQIQSIPGVIKTLHLQRGLEWQ